MTASDTRRRLSALGVSFLVAALVLLGGGTLFNRRFPLAALDLRSLFAGQAFATLNLLLFVWLVGRAVAAASGQGGGGGGLGLKSLVTFLLFLGGLKFFLPGSFIVGYFVSLFIGLGCLAWRSAPRHGEIRD